jgi:hypothetical protein
MSQQITITSEASTPIKPLIESAVRAELRMLKLGLQRTRERLRRFEQRYGFSSEEFERRFQALELGEHLDFIEWAGEIKTYRLLEAQGDALEQATVR